MASELADGEIINNSETYAIILFTAGSRTTLFLAFF